MKLEQYENEGYQFTLIIRKGNWAVFRGIKIHKMGGRQIPCIQWEVIKIKNNKPPSTEEWGINGFTFVDENCAMLKFNTLTGTIIG